MYKLQLQKWDGTKLRCTRQKSEPDRIPSGVAITVTSSLKEIRPASENAAEKTREMTVIQTVIVPLMPNRWKSVSYCYFWILVMVPAFGLVSMAESRIRQIVQPLPGAGGTVHLGLIFDEPSTVSAVRFLQRANDKLQREGLIKFYKYVLETSANAGCGIALEDGDGAIAASELHYHKNVSTFFGPACGSDIEFISRMIWAWDALEFNFYRDFYLNIDTKTPPFVQISTMSAVNVALNLFAVLTVLGWQKIALITCSACFVDTKNDLFSGNTVAMRFEVIRGVLADRGINILDRVDVAQTDYTPQQLAANLWPVKTKARILVAIFGDTLAAYQPYLEALRLAEMHVEEYMTVLTLGSYAFDASRATPPAPWHPPAGGPVDENVFQLFRRSVVVYNDFYNASALSSFLSEMELTGISASDQMAYVQLFESYWLYVYCLEEAFRVTLNPEIHRNSSHIRSIMFTQQIAGPFETIVLDGDSQRLAPYRVFKLNDSNHDFDEIVQIVVVDEDGGDCDGDCATLSGKVSEVYADFFDNLPPDIPQCGFVGELCDQRGTIIVVVVIMMTICAGFVIFLCLRRVKTGETSQMPWAIPSHSICFVDLKFTGSSNMSIHSIQQQMEEANTDSKDMPHSRQLATIEQGFVIVEPFRLKEKLNFDKRDMQLLFQMKQAVHDNINPFIGVCIDKANELYLIWRHCFRGTLSDLLFASKDPNQPDNRPTVVDNNFKGAFVRDIIKGIDFLHSYSIGYHGSLTASQCLVDSHWILKISGFGISRLLFKWRHNGILESHPGVPLIPNSELHYYAPEMRRAIRHAVQRNRLEDLQFSNEDGQAQDMYAFGAILYEILYRRKIVELSDEPEVKETMLEDDAGIGIFSLEAEERLPLYPTFPDDEIHPDLINLMHKCFNGKVDQRPDANMVRKITDATLKMPGSLVDQMIKNMEQYTNNLENLVKEQTQSLEEEQQHAEQILLELLPKSVVDELRLGRRVEPQFYKSVTIMYSDIVGFTSLCSESMPMEVVTLLNGMFKAFDHAISQHKAYKVETIGDAYMVAAGVPEMMKSYHVREIACIALLQREFLNAYEIPHRPGQYLHCRWGFNSGSVFTGVVGVTAPRYCVFGGTVTLAAKMENSGQPDKIQMTLKSYQLLSEQFPEFHCSPRGGVRLEGIGTLLTYWLDRRDELITISDVTDMISNSEYDPLSAGAIIPPPSPPDIGPHAQLGVRHSISPSVNSAADERLMLSVFQNGRL